MEVIPEKFWGHDLVDSIAEVRTVDVFMGFHGAGFVNSFYLQPVRQTGMPSGAVVASPLTLLMAVLGLFARMLPYLRLP